MKCVAGIQRRSRRRSTASVSLFPFLAVLICAMGALILLLVVIARQARLQAAQTAAVEQAKYSENAADLEERLEDLRWRIGQLKESRRTTESQLAEVRLQLGNIENHARHLRNQLAQLEAAWAEMQKSESHGNRQRRQLQAQLQQLRAEITQTQQELTEARAAAEQRRKSYAVVPYQGPNETHRRPIYIECRADSVVLQPEGVVLTESDFDGPMGPGNPLAAALRATREYLSSNPGFDPQESGEPYPLLLVRADGIAAYYAARAAMESWGSEFGYELIGNDWELEFQPPDPELAREIREAVDTARMRQDRLAAAAPSHYGSKGTRATYRVAPYRGGIIRDGGSAADEGLPFRSQRPQGAFTRRFGPPGSSGNHAAGQSQDSIPGSSGESGVGHSGGSQSETPGQDGSQLASRREGLVAGRRPTEQDEAAGRDGPALRPGEWQPGEPSSDQAASPADQPAHAPRSLAQTRGRNWGLRDTGGGSVPLNRPIRVDCYRDRLVIVPEKGQAGGRTVQLPARTEDAIDGFVSAIWEQIDSWGIAGRGMYWRPTLNVYVAPDAGRRYSELHELLDGSGLEIKRRN